MNGFLIAFLAALVCIVLVLSHHAAFLFGKVTAQLEQLRKRRIDSGKAP